MEEQILEVSKKVKKKLLALGYSEKQTLDIIEMLLEMFIKEEEELNVQKK